LDNKVFDTTDARYNHEVHLYMICNLNKLGLYLNF